MHRLPCLALIALTAGPLSAYAPELGRSVRANIAAMAIPSQRPSSAGPVAGGSGVLAHDAIARYQAGRVRVPGALPGDSAVGSGTGSASPASPPSSSLGPR